MPKLTTIYNCSNCSAQSPKWSGRCLDCGAWGTYQAETIDPSLAKATESKKITPAKVTNLNDVQLENFARIKTKLNEFDQTIGGGIVPGSLILIGGEPGIGKSTLMLQITDSLNAIYVSGEESAAQIKTRADRLQLSANELSFISETNVEKIINAIKEQKPQLAIVDSIQTLHSADVPSEAGSINQIRACTVKLLQTAKENNIPIIITGHITKDGLLAGPKTLEHLVDTVVYLEQQKNNDFRILRTAKNRFGSTNEIGLFEMTQVGFKEIKNPAGIFLNEQQLISGNAVSCIIEGTRPFLVEIQALVTKTVFGYPQRKASGFDLNRLQILIAVLTKRANINLNNQDIHINVVGGIKVNDTALDLAICAAIISGLLNQTINKNLILLGEVGLGGEVRNVYKLEQRLQEAVKLNFKQAIIPSVNVKNNLEFKKIKNIKELSEYITK